MFQHVEHRDGGTASGRERRAGQRRAYGRHARAPPCYVRGIERKIQADYLLCAALGQHLKEQAAAAADIQHDAFFFRFAQRAFDESQVIA